ncbi:hypothetical protein L1049_007123 [Liquidambar formosana]|uniref:PAS domain-containing protein n=1 Tax=Liquidambar formosana TaxID=63359 RepID=A0AAP0RI83_LIQFO
MAPADESEESLYRVLLDRYRSLEASHENLREQFDVLVQEQSKGTKVKSDSGEVASDPFWGRFPGYFSARGPYRSVLESMGHAVHVWTAASGEFIYWNPSAEKLFGWKDCEVLGQSVVDLLVSEEYYAPFRKIMERLCLGQSWSGQFPFKKRSGEIFMAIVTKSPLYEDGKLVGAITVSSDAALFNNIYSEKLRTYQDRANGLPRLRGLDLKKIQWYPRPQITSVPHITSVPQIASSVSNLVLVLCYYISFLFSSICFLNYSFF